MSYLAFDINSFFANRYYFLVVSRIAYSATFIKSKLKFFHFKTGIVQRLNHRLGIIFYATEGFIKRINTDSSLLPKESLIAEYNSSYEALSFFRKIYSSFEKVGFFGCKETRELNDAILSNLYEIESSLRQLAFAEDTVPEDSYLTRTASTLNLNAFSNK